MSARKLLSVLFITGLTLLNIQSIQAQEQVIGKVPTAEAAPAPAPAIADRAEAIDVCSSIASRYESKAEQEQAIRCCEKYRQYEASADNSIRKRLDANVLGSSAITSLVDCCVQGTITANPESAEAVAQAKLSCDCQRNPMQAECFSCFGKEHHLNKVDECHEEFTIVYDDENNTAAVMNCYESALATSESLADGSIEDYCGDSSAEYNPDTKMCCTKSREVPVCSCDNPQNIGTAYCGQRTVEQADIRNDRTIVAKKVELDYAYDRETLLKADYYYRQVKRDVKLWGYVQCLFPEQVDHWKAMGVDITDNEIEGYDLTVQAPTSSCDRLKQVIDGSYESSSSLSKRETLSIDRELKACVINFPKCACEEPTVPTSTPDDDPIILDEPPVNPQTAQICFGMADGKQVICDGTDDLVETDRQLVDDLMTMPVFPSELGTAENWERYQTLVTIWEDMKAGRISTAEARSRMTAPAHYLAERWLEHKSKDLVVKSLRMKANSVIGASTTATLGSLSRDEVVIATNANDSKSVYVQRHPESLSQQSFSTALNSNLGESTTDFIALPVMKVNLRGGACGASLTGTGHFAGSQNALLWLFMITFIALAGFHLLHWRRQRS